MKKIAYGFLAFAAKQFLAIMKHDRIVKYFLKKIKRWSFDNSYVVSIDLVNFTFWSLFLECINNTF